METIVRLKYVPLDIELALSSLSVNGRSPHTLDCRYSESSTARNMALGINYGRLCPACLENRDTDGVATLVPIEIGYDTQHKAC